MLDQCQCFKAAFLSRCAKLGLNEEQMLALVKEARRQLPELMDKSASWVDDTISKATGAAGSLARLGLYGLLVPPVAAIGAGGLAGVAAARFPSLSDTDPKELSTQEKIEAYRRATKRLSLQSKIRQLHDSIPASYSRL